MSTQSAPGRSPLAAAVLSLAATGLGQIYCGRIVRGLVMFLGSLLFAPAIVAAALLPPATVVLAGLVLALLTVLAVYALAVVDAFRLARRGRDHFQPKDYNHPLVYALFILVGLTYPAGGVYFVRSTAFEAFAIPTASEVPTLLPGERVLVNKTTYRRRFVRRGGEVVFSMPSQPGLKWAKRVIALPGDTVEVKDNEVFVNGQKLPREPVPRASLGAAAQEANGVLVIGLALGSPSPARAQFGGPSGVGGLPVDGGSIEEILLKIAVGVIVNLVSRAIADAITTPSSPGPGGAWKAPGRLVVDRAKPGEWELVEIEDLQKGCVAVRFHTGYLCADAGGGRGVIADRKQVGEWERWRLVINDDKTISLVTERGFFLCAERGGRVR